MASIYSPNLALNLMGTGDQVGTWGVTTNLNLGTMLEQAISAYVTQPFNSADITLAMANGADGGNNITVGSIYTTGTTSAPVSARNMTIECTGTSSGNNLIVPFSTKLYFVYNNITSGGGAITVKTASDSGVSVPVGARAALVCGLNGGGWFVTYASNYFGTLNLGGPIKLNAANPGIGVSKTAIVSATESRSSTTTLTNSAYLALPIVAGTHEVVCVFSYTPDINAGIQFNLNFSGTFTLANSMYYATGIQSISGPNSGFITPVIGQFASSPAAQFINTGGGINNTLQMFSLTGSIVATTSGTIGFSWAQSTATGTTSLAIGSYLKITQLA